MKDTSSKTLDNLTLLVKLVALLLVANIFMIWYGVYELRCYRQATKGLRSGVNFVERDNNEKFAELTKFIQDQKKRSSVSIENRGTVNFRDVK